MNNFKFDYFDVFKKANELDADRIVFVKDGDFVFIKNDIEIIKNFYENNNSILSSLKFKFQKNNKIKWFDVSSYQRVIDTVALKDHVKSFSLEKNNELVELIIFCHTNNQSNLVALLLRRKLINYIRMQYNRFDQIRMENIESFCNELLCNKNLLIDNNISFFLSYIQTFNLIGTKLNSGKNAKNVYEDCIIEKQVSESSVASNILLGQLASLFDRNISESHFDLVKMMDKNIVKSFYLDMGANTYFSRKTIQRELDNKNLVGAINDNNKHEIENKLERKLSFCISVDSSFLRVYGPLIVYFARNFKSYNFHMVIVGKNMQCINNSIEGFTSLCHEMDRFTGLVGDFNFSFTKSILPDWVKESKTYYACARFFAVNELLKSYSKVYVVDADVFWEDDPAQYFNSLKGSNLSINMTKQLMAKLSPWRRYLAGNMYFESSNHSFIFIDELTKYISVGLQFENSWMLDQNALAYAVEHLDILNISDLSGLKRPFKQREFRVILENNIKSVS